MKHSRKFILCIFIILSLTSKSQTQSDTNFPQPSLLCISDCATCPVICSSPPSPPPTPKQLFPLPPPPPSPPVHHYSPPMPYYYVSPSPSSPPAHYPPPPPPPPTGGAAPPRPSVYVYNPGTTAGQRNFSYPYYYFYASKASTNFLSLHRQGSILLTLFIFLRVLSEY